MKYVKISSKEIEYEFVEHNDSDNPLEIVIYGDNKKDVETVANQIINFWNKKASAKIFKKLPTHGKGNYFYTNIEWVGEVIAFDREFYPDTDAYNLPKLTKDTVIKAIKGYELIDVGASISIKASSKYRKTIHIIRIFSMSIEEAKKMLELDKNPGMSVKDAYKKAAIKHHPDKGGDTATMQKVNEAYALLKDKPGGSGFSKKDGVYRYQAPTREEREKEAEKTINKSKIVLDLLKKAFDPKEYQTYFKKFVGKDLSYDESIAVPEMNKWGDANRSYINMRYEFYTDDRETVFYILINISLRDIDFSNTLGGGTPDISLKYYTENYLYHNKRKQKMKQRSWEFKNTTGDVINPEKMFPPDTLKKVFSGKKQRKFAKRDFIQGLIRELKADWDGEYSRIPLDSDKLDRKGIYLTIWRHTFMKKGIWGINGIYENGKRTAFPHVVSIPETEDALNLIINTVKEMRKKKSVADMEKVMLKMINKETIKPLYKE